MRDRLIELLDRIFKTDYKGDYESGIEDMADRLLAEGVIVPPVKVGDAVYDIADGTAYETKVLSLNWWGGNHWGVRTVSSFPSLDEFGTRIFLTREEAEKALERSEK